MASGRTLTEWLQYQEKLHPASIDLGLERVSKVWDELVVDAAVFDCPVIVVGGTNGKGSTIAFLENIYLQAGYRPLAYTSPHIDRYNERIRYTGQEVTDEQLVEAFEIIESKRGETSLSYFEFGTLAALLIAIKLQPDILLLEVGLGGRLDAVNILQHDLAIITNISLDHTEWLGDTREQIAAEKVAIARKDRPLILADKDMPLSLLEQANRTGAKLFGLGQEFDVVDGDGSWHYRQANAGIDGLPVPGMAGDHQLNNAAAALCAVNLLQSRLSVAETDIRQALAVTRLAGRFEKVSEHPAIFLDVAHNPAAAGRLHDIIMQLPVSGKWHAILAIQANRDIIAFVEPLKTDINDWYVAGMLSGAGHTAIDLADTIRSVMPDANVYQESSIAQALDHACECASQEDRILVLGSFYTVSEARTSLHV